MKTSIRRRTCAPASRNRFARSISHFGSRVPAFSSSSIDASPPAPHWIPTSGFAFNPYELTSFTRSVQSSAGRLRKPELISRTSNLRTTQRSSPSIDPPAHLPEIFTCLQVFFDGLFVAGRCCQDSFDVPTGTDIALVSMCYIDEISQTFLWHQGKGTASKSRHG